MPSPFCHHTRRFVHSLFNSMRQLKRRPSNRSLGISYARRLALEPLEARTLLSIDLLSRAAGLPEVPGMGIQLSNDLFLVLDSAQPSNADALSSPPTGQRPYGAQLADTSEYMIGDVYVTVVLMESNGSIDAQTENWTTAQKNEVISEVTHGLTWWETSFANQNSTSALEFTIDTAYATNPYNTGYEPVVSNLNRNARKPARNRQFRCVSAQGIHSQQCASPDSVASSHAFPGKTMHLNCI